jgi:predicted ester cyclase
MPVNLEVNKRLLRDLYAALDAQDYDRVSEFLAEDALVYVVGTDVEYSKEAIMEFVRTVYAGFPDFTHVIDEISHQGDYRGLPATGNTVTYGGAAFFTVLDGQLKEVWLVDDNLSLMQQIGMELVPTATNN